ncbi:hypothetical protein KF840_26225 [bacterium]|nr:hypothetical protein [bacterium]
MITTRWLGTLAVGAAIALAPLAAAAKPARSAPPYVPGLGEIMGATQMRHLKLWYAGEAGNWPLASYEVDELAEGFADAVRYHPRHKDAPRPLTELMPEFTTAPIAALRAAIRAHDATAFVAAYDALTEGCNGCHQAAGFGFNAVIRPTANPYSNQQFAPPNNADATGR